MPFGAGLKRCVVLLASTLVCNFYLLRAFVTWSNEMQEFKVCQLGHFLIITNCVLVKYSHAFIERLSQGTSSLALRLTTVSLDETPIMVIVIIH